MQFITLVITVVALAASAFANPILSERQLQTCGAQQYNPSQYTCYLTPSPPLLCPITNGIIYQRCGAACYNPRDYGCENGQLVPTGSCNGQVYDKNSYVCINGHLCNVTHPNLCGPSFACYTLSEYRCVNGVLVHV